MLRVTLVSLGVLPAFLTHDLEEGEGGGGEREEEVEGRKQKFISTQISSKYHKTLRHPQRSYIYYNNLII